MDEENVDTLRYWLEALTIPQLAALWRWVTKYYMFRMDQAWRNR